MKLIDHKTEIEKMCVESLTKHFKKEFTVFEMSERMKILQDLGFKNEEIARKLGVTESALYCITPIRNINNKTRELIDDNLIDGYKVARLMRIIGKKNPKETILIKEVISKGLGSNAAEIYVSKTKPNYNFDLHSWISQGKNNLTKIKEVKLSKDEKNNIKIIILRLNELL